MGKRSPRTDPFEQEVAAYVEQHALLCPEDRVGVAVSGGADSVCLLLVLHALRVRMDYSLRVVHVNHSLRGAASDDDSLFVEELARDLDLPVDIHQIPASEIPVSGVEAWARGHRLAFFHGMLRDGAVDRMATGHHEDDQAETVLFRLLRGAGGHGLGGIAPRTTAGLIRPLLGQSRESILRYLVRKGAPWRTDATNADLHFSRNALRHKWIPALAKEWNPRIVSVLAATAEQLREESSLLAVMAAEQFQRLFSEGVYGLVATRAQFAEAPVAMQRRILVHATRVAGSSRQQMDAGWLTTLDSGLDFRQIEAVRHLFTAQGVSGKHLVRGLQFERSGGYVRVTGEESAGRKVGTAIEVPQGEPGCFRPDGSLQGLEIRYLTGSQTDNPLDRDGKCGYTDGWSFLESIRLRYPLILRPWREGDAYQPAGARSKRKLKQLFQRRDIPHWKRRDELILESEGEVIWSSSFGVSAERLATCAGSNRLALRLRKFGEDWESS